MQWGLSFWIQQEGEAACCFDCRQCPENEIFCETGKCQSCRKQSQLSIFTISKPVKISCKWTAINSLQWRQSSSFQLLENHRLQFIFFHWNNTSLTVNFIPALSSWVIIVDIATYRKPLFPHQSSMCHFTMQFILVSFFCYEKHYHQATYKIRHLIDLKF